MEVRKIKLLTVLVISHIVLFYLALNTSNIQILTILSLFQVVVLIIVMGKNNGRSAFLPMAFISISYIFNLSGLVLGEILGAKNGYLFYLKFDNETVIKGIVYYMAITGSMALGTCLSGDNFRLKLRFRAYDEIKMKNISKVFIIIGIIPHLIIIYMLLSARLSGGYAATYEVSRQGVGFLSVFFYYGALFLIYTSSDKKEIIRIFLLIIPIEIISMFSGRRYEAISFLISLFIVYLYKFERLNPKIVIKGTIIAFIGVVIVNAFGAIREGNIGEINDLSRFETTNVLYSFFTEMGNTIRTLLLVIKYVPSVLPYGNGKSYLEFIPRITPGINFLMRGEYNFTMLLPENYNIGGSYVAELYYNFKWFGTIIAFIIGKLLSKFDSNIRAKGTFNSIIAICLLFPTIEYIRDIFYVYRYGVYYIIITYLFYMIKIPSFRVVQE